MPDPGDARRAYQVLIDFDNTISRGDVLDGIIERFSPGDEWRRLEEEWAGGRITTRACLEGQVRGLRATRAEVEAHLGSIRLDPGFSDLLAAVKEDEAEITIVSDNFDGFVEPVLANHGYAAVAHRTNRVEFRGDRAAPTFPFYNPACPGCAHCKKTHFVPRRDARRVVYVGDGLSDLCPAGHADLVFAKDSLRARLQAAGIAHVPYGGLAEVAAYLRNNL